MIYMAITARQEYETDQKNNQLNVRNLVLQAIEQASTGNVKDFNEVCERLEKKYTNA